MAMVSAWAGRWRVALLLGRRDVTRHVLRSVLVVLAVALSTGLLGMVVVTVARALVPGGGLRVTGISAEPEDGPGPFGTISMDRATLVVLLCAGALAVLQTVLLVAPAFLVGVRRRLRELGLLLAVGGRAADVRRIVLAPAVVCGLVGSVLGALGGTTMALLSGPVRSPAEAAVLVPATLLVVGLGALVAVAAALVPAVVATRIPAVLALAGRVAPHRRSRALVVRRAGLAVVALAVVVVGVRIALAGREGDVGPLVGGVVLAEAGLVTLVGAGLGALGRVPAHGVVAAFVLRDAARHRLRVLPAVSASLVLVAGATAGLTYQQSLRTQDERTYAQVAPVGAAFVATEASSADDLAALRDAAGTVSAVRTVAAVHLAGGAGLFLAVGDVPAGPPEPLGRTSVVTQSGPLVGDAALVDALGLGAPAARALAAGDVLLASDEDLEPGGTVRLTPPGGETVAVPATVVPAVRPYADIVLSAGAAERLGLPVEVAGAVVVPERPYTDAERDRLDAALAPAAPIVEHGPGVDPDIDDRGTRYALVIGGALAVLLVTWVMTALAAEESRGDLATLQAVGASPGARRRIAAGQAGLVAALGSWCGVPAGVALGALFVSARSADLSGDPYRLAPLTGPLAGPLLALLVGLPLLVALLAALTTRTSVPLARRTDR